jgi:hypothetical protein
MRKITTQPACKPMATAIFPVSMRVRLKISPTINHDSSESYTSPMWARGANERTNKSKPLCQPSSSAGMRTLAYRCSTANRGAVSSAAAQGPDSASMAVCIAPRMSVSSMSATATPELNASAKIRAMAGGASTNCGSLTRRPVCSRNTAPKAAESMPIAPHLRLRVRKVRQGRP